ncbi:MAG TPA: PRC-barrel domain-containing protein [Candidatus Dormibacteraeota bacterium]
MRELHIGEDVLGKDGERLGEVDLIVVDPAAHRVTHVVVDGHLLGVQRLRDAGPDGLAADLDRDTLKKLPVSDHEHVGEPGSNWSAPFGYQLGNFLAITGALIGQAPYQPPVHFDEGLEDVHEITEGSPVWSGNHRLGEVERVLTDDSGAVTEFVIRPAHILAKPRRVPIGRVTEVVGNNVHTDLGPDELERLPGYSEIS